MLKDLLGFFSQTVKEFLAKAKEEFQNKWDHPGQVSRIL